MMRPKIWATAVLSLEGICLLWNVFIPSSHPLFDVLQKSAVKFVDGIDVGEQQSQEFVWHVLFFADFISEPLKDKMRQDFNSIHFAAQRSSVLIIMWMHTFEKLARLNLSTCLNFSKKVTLTSLIKWHRMECSSKETYQVDYFQILLVGTLGHQNFFGNEIGSVRRISLEKIMWGQEEPHFWS